MKISKFIKIILFLITAINPLPTETALADERPVVKIGVIFPLTGPMSSFGEDMAKSIPLLEKAFNNEQSKYTFKLILEDGKFGQTNAAITAAKKLVEIDGARFLAVGSSGEILQIASYLESSKVLAVTGFAGSPDVKNAGDYVFRTYIDLGRGMRQVADELIKQNITRMAIISEESSFSLANKNSLHEFLGDRIVFSEDTAMGEADLKTIIAKARSKNPQVYYVNTAAPASFINVYKQLRSNGIQEPFYTYYLPGNKDVQNGLGDSLKGTIFLDYPTATETSPAFQKFQNDFQSTYGAPRAPFNFRTNYNAIRVIFEGIMAAGPDATKVKDYLYKYDAPSATGRLRFDENGDVVDLKLELKTY